MVYRLFLLLLFLPFCSTAQFTLDASYNFDVGDSYTQHINDSLSGLQPGPSGANVTWDFSTYGTTSTAPVNLQAANNNSYPNADVYFSQSGTQSFFSTSNQALGFYGSSSSFGSLIYTNPEEQVRYPMSYGDSYTDYKEGNNIVAGQVQDITGTITVRADGYGTLITPAATYNNALRLQLIRKDSFRSQGQVTSTVTDTFYYWYAANIDFTVATLFGSGQQRVFNYIEAQATNTLEAQAQALRLYPNPAASFLQVKGWEHRTFDWKVYNSLGLLVQEGQNDTRIPVAELSSGWYAVEVQSEQGTSARLPFLKE